MGDFSSIGARLLMSSTVAFFFVSLSIATPLLAPALVGFGGEVEGEATRTDS